MAVHVNASPEPLAGLAPSSPHRGYRLTPPLEDSKAQDTTPAFVATVDQLWLAWLAVTAEQPRTKLLARNDQTHRTVHVHRSRFFRFPDLIRAEIVELGSNRASIAIDSRSRYGYYDFGVNRRRVQKWVALLTQAVENAQ